MKFSDKVYTYKDIEEAKKLIGKKVIASDSLQGIEEHNALSTEPCTLCAIDEYKMLSRRYLTSISTESYQFIREVIEDEPSYRPFKSIAELVEYWCKNNNNLWQHRNLTIPLIWVKDKNTGHNCLIIEYNKDCVFMNGDDVGVSMEELFNEYEFLDGSPIGVVIE